MLNTNRTIQISANAIALTLFAAAMGCGRGQNPQAQLALLAGALPISLVASYHGYLADRTEPYTRMRDAAALEMYAGQLAAAIEVPSLPMPAPMMPAPLPAPMAPADEGEAITYFDWNLIQSQPDKYAHLAIVGGTGDGKTTLTQSLLQFLGEKAIAVDPHWQPGNYPGIPTVAKGRNYGSYPADAIVFSDLVAGADCSYTEVIATIHAEMDRRYKLLRQGKPVGDRYSFILDEYTTFAGNHPKCSKGEVLDLIREARKVGLRLILLVQSDLLEDFHWQGQGAARKSLRWCRLGEFAETFAKGQKDDALIAWVDKQDYPILVDKSPALLPVPLSAIRQPIHQQTISNSAQSEFDVIRNYLDRLYGLPGYKPSENSLDKGEMNGGTISPSSEIGEMGEMSETQSHRDVSPSSETFHPDQNANEPGSSGSLGESETRFTLDEASQVFKLKKSGNNQTQILAALWGVKPGKAQSYRDACEKFKAIKAYWENLGLW